MALFKILKGDGNLPTEKHNGWAYVKKVGDNKADFYVDYDDNTRVQIGTYDVATTTTTGLMTGDMVAKLDGIREEATHVEFEPTYTEGTDLGTIKIDDWVYTLYAPGAFGGASETTPGTIGFVPAPAAGESGYFLKGDGTWFNLLDKTVLEDVIGLKVDRAGDTMTGTLILGDLVSALEVEGPATFKESTTISSTGTLLVKNTATSTGTTAADFAVQIDGGVCIAKNLRIKSAAYASAGIYVGTSNHVGLFANSLNSTSSTSEVRLRVYRKYRYTTSSSSGSSTTRYSKSDQYETYYISAGTASSSSATGEGGRYKILTTKNDVAVSEGGTGKSSWTANQLIYSSKTTTLANTANIYVNDSQLGVNVSAVPAEGISLMVGGDTLVSGNITCDLDGIYAIGAEDCRWATVYATTFNGNATSADKVNNTFTVNGISFDGQEAKDAGIIETQYGGTGTSDAPSKGGIIYGASTTAYASTAAGESGQYLKSNAAEAPAWTTFQNLTINVKNLAGVVKTTTTYNPLEEKTIDISAENLFETYEFTETKRLTTNWQDTNITGTSMESGSYIIQVYVDDHSGSSLSHWYERYTGVMSWHSGGTNDDNVDEIVLHKAGHASNDNNIYLRTKRNSSGKLTLQICANKTSDEGAETTYTITTRRLLG